MKHLLTFTCSILVSVCIAQTEGEGETKQIQIVDEVSVSINYSTFWDNNTSGRFGFGVGVYRSFFREKRVNLNTGIEFNQMSQEKKLMYESHFAHNENVTYHIYNFSIPASARIQFGQRTIFFVEAGAFVDFLLAASSRGTRISYVPDENNQVVYSEKKFTQKERFSSINAGLSFGLGLRIPIKKIELLLRPDYRYGLVKLASNQDDVYNRFARLSLGVRW